MPTNEVSLKLDGTVHDALHDPSICHLFDDFFKQDLKRDTKSGRIYSLTLRKTLDPESIQPQELIEVLTQLLGIFDYFESTAFCIQYEIKDTLRSFHLHAIIRLAPKLSYKAIQASFKGYHVHLHKLFSIEDVNEYHKYIHKMDQKFVYEKFEKLYYEKYQFLLD